MFSLSSEAFQSSGSPVEAFRIESDLVIERYDTEWTLYGKHGEINKRIGVAISRTGFG